MENCDLYLDEMFSKIWTWRVLILHKKPDFRKHGFFQHFLEKNWTEWRVYSTRLLCFSLQDVF